MSGRPRALFKRFYDVTPEGNWEGHTILNRINMPALADDATEAELAKCREMLLQARASRVRPGWDDKVLADWNGLMIAAMAEAGIVFERPDWVETARRAFDFIRREMTTGEGPTAAYAGGGPRPASRQRRRLRQSVPRRAGPARSEQRGRIYHSGTAMDRRCSTAITATPRAAAISFRRTTPSADHPRQDCWRCGDTGWERHARRGLTRLAILTGEDAYRRRAEAIVETFSGELARNFFPLATLLNNAEVLAEPVQIVIVGEPGDEAFNALHHAVYSASLPNRVVLSLPPGRELPADHPAHGKGLVDDRAAAYVCVGPVCSLPLTDPEKLVANLVN